MTRLKLETYQLKERDTRIHPVQYPVRTIEEFHSHDDHPHPEPIETLQFIDDTVRSALQYIATSCITAPITSPTRLGLIYHGENIGDIDDGMLDRDDQHYIC
jgi:hypothetical protein